MSGAVGKVVKNRIPDKSALGIWNEPHLCSEHTLVRTFRALISWASATLGAQLVVNTCILHGLRLSSYISE